MWGFHSTVAHLLVPNYHPGRAAATHGRGFANATIFNRHFAKRSRCGRENRKKNVFFPFNSFIKFVYWWNKESTISFCSWDFRAVNRKSRISIGGLGNELRGQRIGLSGQISASNPRQFARHAKTPPLFSGDDNHEWLFMVVHAEVASPGGFSYFENDISPLRRCFVF